MFKVGQKVVCIDDVFSIIKNTPIKGEIYTVRSFYYSTGGYAPSIYLNEIVNEKVFFGVEPSFETSRFRAIDETFAEEVLKNILEQVKELELA